MAVTWNRLPSVPHHNIVCRKITDLDLSLFRFFYCCAVACQTPCVSPASAIGWMDLFEGDCVSDFGKGVTTGVREQFLVHFWVGSCEFAGTKRILHYKRTIELVPDRKETNYRTFFCFSGTIRIRIINSYLRSPSHHIRQPSLWDMTTARR